MKKHEYSFMLETYEFTYRPVSRRIDWHKCWDIEGRRKIKRYNLIVRVFKTTYWFSFRVWSAK